MCGVTTRTRMRVSLVVPKHELIGAFRKADDGGLGIVSVSHVILLGVHRYCIHKLDDQQGTLTGDWAHGYWEHSIGRGQAIGARRRHMIEPKLCSHLAFVRQPGPTLMSASLRYPLPIIPQSPD